MFVPLDSSVRRKRLGLRSCLLTLLVAASLIGAAHAVRAEDDLRTARSTGGMVVSVSRPATEAGAAVLKRGGNVVDAAVAVAFALAVTHPEAGNVGGGGYLLVRPADGSAPVVFDFREQAPAAARRDMFVDPQSRTAHRRVGVPGTVRGLELAHKRLGSLPWKDLVTPAVQLATDGFALDAPQARSLDRIVRTSPDPASAELRRVFSKPGGGAWQAGDRLVQPDLAWTLRHIAESGADGFYAGPVAERLVEEMERGGGLVTRADLLAYKAIERPALHGTYRGFDVWCVPPSSSGGTTLLMMLGMLETFDLRADGRWSPRTLHRMTEAMQRAYRDRARFLGDPAFVEIPADLLDKDRLRRLAETIPAEKATPSADLAGDIVLAAESEETTHFSVVDARGGAASLTYTLEQSYGSRVVVRGAGFVLNDEMNDFNWIPGRTDATGRIGTPANEVAPGKRMLSSMCPTIVSRDGKTVLVTGSPGGRTIVNTVLNVIVDVVDFGMDARQAVDAPRMHHGWFPDVLVVERALADRHADVLRALREAGRRIEIRDRQGDAHTIGIDPRTGERLGAADARISGAALADR